MKRISKLALMTILCSLSLLFAVPEFSICANAASAGEEGIQPQADIIQWVYEQRGTHLYKRLYNASTGNWVGDWIYVGEVPGKGEPIPGKHPYN